MNLATVVRDMILRALALAAISIALAPATHAAESGLISKASSHSVPDTIARFERAVKAKDADGWVVFTELDHAAAASKIGLALKPRTVIVFGNPKLGTPAMQKAPTLAIDLPMKAIVWQDDQDKVWLTYNSADYLATQVYPRHGLSIPTEGAKALDQVLAGFADEATRQN
jgi:uncharacterized protein (DUF302 family)